MDKTKNILLRAVKLVYDLHLAYKASKEKTKLQLPKEEVDFDNLNVSMSKSRELYKRLITRAHPDRYTDERLKELMETLSARITEHKHDFKVLKELELEFINIKK